MTLSNQNSFFEFGFKVSPLLRFREQSTMKLEFLTTLWAQDIIYKDYHKLINEFLEHPI